MSHPPVRRRSAVALLVKAFSLVGSSTAAPASGPEAARAAMEALQP